MKQLLAVISAMMIFLGWTSLGFSADTIKIAVIDFQRIVQESSAGKISQKEIRIRGEGLQKKIMDEKKNLDEMKQSIERESLVLSPEKQDEKKREFRIKVNDFKKMQQDIQKQFKQLEIQKLNEIQKQVFELANEIGGKEGYSLILEKKASGLVYYFDKLDITDTVIKAYNLKISKTD